LAVGGVFRGFFAVRGVVLRGAAVVVGRTNPEEVEREVRRLRDERLRLATEAAGGASERHAEEARELEAAGWERRGEGPKAIWRKPGGGRWWPHYQAVLELRRERLASEAGPEWPGGAP
jgi:hypothetical protein